MSCGKSQCQMNLSTMVRLWHRLSSKIWLLRGFPALIGAFVDLLLLTKLRLANVCGGSGQFQAKGNQLLRPGAANNPHSAAAEPGSPAPMTQRRILCIVLLATLSLIPTISTGPA